jgi:hypothetical protein
VVEERLNELKSTVDASGTPRRPLIAVNTSLAAYWGSLTKVKGGTGQKLNPHWYSCAVAFGTYVRTELVTEADYDKSAAQWLELAASISTEAGGDISHNAVIEAADLLKDRPKDCAKQLAKILATLKTPTALKSDKVKEMLAAIFASGHLATIVIPMIGAEIAHIEDGENARSAYLAMQTAIGMFEQNVDETGARRFPDDVMDGWLRAKEDATKGPELKTGSDVVNPPAEQPKPKGKGRKTPEAPAETAEQPMAAAA